MASEFLSYPPPFFVSRFFIASTDEKGQLHSISVFSQPFRYKEDTEAFQRSCNIISPGFKTIEVIIFE